MIFQVLQIRKMASEAKENPGKFAGGQVGELFISMFVLPTLFAIAFLSGLFVLGYTTLLGGPYGFFKVIFLLSIFGILCIVYFLIKIYKMIQGVTKKVVDATITVESKVVE